MTRKRSRYRVTRSETVWAESPEEAAVMATSIMALPKAASVRVRLYPLGPDSQSWTIDLDRNRQPLMEAEDLSQHAGVDEPGPEGETEHRP